MRAPSLAPAGARHQGVGGSFDVLAGYIKRAPGWAQAMGLEWFWRLLMEPRKLWKRPTNSEFIWRAGQEIVARRRGRLPSKPGLEVKSGLGPPTSEFGCP